MHCPEPHGRLGPGYDIEMSRMITMRDGVEFEAWSFKPSQLKSKAPTVLELTQYDIDGVRHRDFEEFVNRGYVFVQALVRGRGGSGGAKSDDLGLQVGRDGYDKDGQRCSLRHVRNLRARTAKSPTLIEPTFDFSLIIRRPDFQAFRKATPHLRYQNDKGLYCTLAIGLPRHRFRAASSA